jgi:hypothetical protein
MKCRSTQQIYAAERWCIVAAPCLSGYVGIDTSEMSERSGTSTMSLRPHVPSLTPLIASHIPHKINHHALVSYNNRPRAHDLQSWGVAMKSGVRAEMDSDTSGTMSSHTAIRPLMRAIRPERKVVSVYRVSCDSLQTSNHPHSILPHQLQLHNMAAKYSRRPSYLDAPLSPSIIPNLAILPRPLPADDLPCGQLVSKTSKHNPTSLEDRDYDDIGTRWYKDVIFFSTEDGRFVESFGGTHLVQKPLDEGLEAGTIEAEEQRVRLLKDTDAALEKIWKDEAAKEWIQEQNANVGFVVANRQVANASYKRARLVDVGNGNWEVVREVSGEDKAGNRRDSGLDVRRTNSKWDTVGVVVRKIVVEGEGVKLGEGMCVDFWN